ncbi:hypothetical protein TWF481_002019 [Arthrobotrys musiformis]
MSVNMERNETMQRNANPAVQRADEQLLSPALDVFCKSSTFTDGDTRATNHSFDFMPSGLVIESPDVFPLAWEGLQLFPAVSFATEPHRASNPTDGTPSPSTKTSDFPTIELLEYQNLAFTPASAAPSPVFATPYPLDNDPNRVTPGKSFPQTSESDHEKRSKTHKNLIDKVAELHTKLYAQYEPNRPNEHNSQIRQHISAVSDKFNVGETFALSQNLLDIQKRFRITSTADYSLDFLVQYGSYDVGCRGGATTGRERGTDNGGSNDSTLHDPASILLLLSCRVRVLYIYRRVLSDINDVFHKGELVSSTTRDHESNSVNIGGLDWQASPKLQAIITLQAMEYFLTSFQTEPSDKSTEVAEERGGRFDPIAKTTIEAIKKAEAETLLAIKRIKCLI